MLIKKCVSDSNRVLFTKVNQIVNLLNNPKSKVLVTASNKQSDEIKPHCYHCKKRARGCVCNQGNWSCFQKFVHV